MSAPQSKEGIVYEVPVSDYHRYGAVLINSDTLVSGWAPEATEHLREAITAVVSEHPVLGGRVVRLDPKDHTIVGVEANAHSKFLYEHQGPSDFEPKANLMDRIEQISSPQFQKYFEEYFLDTAPAVVDNGTPLFRVVLLRLPDNHVCYRVMLSHLIGDGSTYYKIIGLLNEKMNGRSTDALHFKPAGRHVEFDDSYSNETKEFLGTAWIPKYMELIATTVQGHADIGYEIVDQSAVEELKQEHTAITPGVDFLSTNDIVTAALMEAADGEIGLLFADMRGRTREAENNTGGNYERCIMYDRAKSVCSPGYVRQQLVTKFFGFEDGIPNRQALIDSDLIAVTNWATLTTFITPAGATLLSHVPAGSVVLSVPVPVFVIFKPNADKGVAIMHNLRQKEFFSKNITKSTMLKRVIGRNS